MYFLKSFLQLRKIALSIFEYLNIVVIVHPRPGCSREKWKFHFYCFEFSVKYRQQREYVVHKKQEKSEMSKWSEFSIECKKYINIRCWVHSVSVVSKFRWKRWIIFISSKRCTEDKTMMKPETASPLAESSKISTQNRRSFFFKLNNMTTRLKLKRLKQGKEKSCSDMLHCCFIHGWL